MWAPLSIALLIGFVGQLTIGSAGSAGLATVFGVLLLALVGFTVLRRRSSLGQERS